MPPPSTPGTRTPKPETVPAGLVSPVPSGDAPKGRFVMAEKVEEAEKAEQADTEKRTAVPPRPINSATFVATGEASASVTTADDREATP